MHGLTVVKQPSLPIRTNSLTIEIIKKQREHKRAKKKTRITVTKATINKILDFKKYA